MAEAIITPYKKGTWGIMTREEREKAIETLKMSVPIKALTREEFNNYIQILNKIMDWLEQEPKTEWIPVSEGLPEKPDNYPYCGIYRTYFLVSLASGCVETLGYEFDRDEWQVTGAPVVAWMPLPEPYKAESEG